MVLAKVLFFCNLDLYVSVCVCCRCGILPLSYIPSPIETFLSHEPFLLTVTTFVLSKLGEKFSPI